MRPKQQEVRRNWRWSAAALALTLTMGSSALLSSNAGAASEPLPQTLVHRSRELSGTLNLDQPQTVTIPRHGQVTRMTLPVVAGQKLLLKVAGQSTAPTGSVVGYAVQTPTGGLVLSSGNANEAATFNLNYLTTSGDYMVTITNGHATSAQMQVAVEQAPQ